MCRGKWLLSVQPRKLSEELDQWLLNGGWLVTSSERAARFIASEFNRARRDEGLAVWQNPDIFSWPSFLLQLWHILTEHAQSPDSRMVLSSAQEIAIWEGILAASGSHAAILTGPRHHLATLAAEAHRLLAAYAPHMLAPQQRLGWQNDAGQMSRWLAEFDSYCAKNDLLSAARLPLEILSALEQSQASIDSLPPIKLHGFDRFEPMQHTLLEAIGKWTIVESPPREAHVAFHQAPDSVAELKACVLWCSAQLQANPGARLLVLTNDVATRRGEFERAFARWLQPPISPAIEFSLGVPLASLPLVRAAMLLLRWLSTPLAEYEVDWLFASGFATVGNEEREGALSLMRELRQRQRQQPEWQIQQFLLAARSLRPEMRAWCGRTEAVRVLFRGRTNNQRLSPREWSERLLGLLDAFAWPGGMPLSSANFQARQRFEQLIEGTAALGFDGRKVAWSDYMPALKEQLAESLFAAESSDAPILIAGPAEAAGLSADAIWMLGAEEGSWPASGSTNPLLPFEVQQKASMPHASAAVDWHLAQKITGRIVASAPVVYFSCATLRETEERKPSRLIEQFAGAAERLPSNLIATAEDALFVESIEENRCVPFEMPTERGGASLLSEQSQCPFKAFAVRRMNALGWDEATPGFTPLEKGNLLHAILRAIWDGKANGGLSGSADLLELIGERKGSANLEHFVRRHVREQLAYGINSSMRERILPELVEIEEGRLVRIITEWLLYESHRIHFEVVAREMGCTVEISGLTLNLRIDRVDKMSDGTLLVIDYKSGLASCKEWELPRPEDVQLPLYAAFGTTAMQPGQGGEATIGGLAFAKLGAGTTSFEGRLRDAKSQLLPTLKGNSALVRSPLTENDLSLWKTAIEKLAADFLRGKAEVDPADPEKTCAHCNLQVLCRRQEAVAITEDPTENDGDMEGGDGNENE